MKISDFRKAMRPKKYLTRDFIVYQDPKMQAARSEMQAGGVVEREGFAKGPPNPKGRSEDLLTGRGANDLIDAFIKAHAKDDISFLFQKTAANPNGVLDKEGLKALSKVINNPKGLEKFVEKTKLDADTIYDMLDEREAFKNLDLESAMKKSSTAGTREQIKTTLSNGEDWLIKNSKNYDTVKDLKKGFKRVFGKNHPFLKESLTFTEDNLTKFKPLFFDDIKLTKTPGATPSYKLQKYSLDQIFNASLYNFNPEVRDEVLNDLNDILSQKVTTKTKGDIRKQLLNNKRLTELGINKRLQGPITRLLMKDINEDIVENLKFIKQPIRGTPNLLNYLKDKVDPKYRKQFELASKAITQIQAKKYDGAKETLNIAENINFDHKIPQSVIELGYADEIEFAKVNPVGENFNQNVKRTQFDSKINRLIRVYEATPDKDKPKIIKKMNAVKDSFNKRYNNYLGDISIKQVDGKLNFSSKAKVLETGTDIMKALKTNIKKTPDLFQQLDVDPETREVLNRLNNKLSMNPFDAEGLFKSEISKLKKIGTPAAKFIGGVLGGLIAEVGFEAAFAIPAYARGEDFDEILGNTLFGLAGAGKTRLEKVVEESGFDPDVVKYADLVNRKKQFIADVGTLEYFGKPGVNTGYAEIFSPGEKSPLEKRLIENAQIIDKELDQLQEGSPLQQKFQKAEEKLEKRYAEKVEGSTPRKFLKETGESVLDYFKDQDQQLNKRFEELERLGFKKGGFGKIGRRGFLKLAAGIAAIIGGVRGGVKQLKTPIAKKVLKDAPEGTPDWFAPLVEKIAKEGIDVPGVNVKTTTTRETVKKLEVPNPESDGAITDKYYLFENPDTGEIRIDIDSPGLGANDGEFSLYFRPDRIDGITDDGIPMRSDGEFFVTEDRVVGRASSPDDYDIDLEPLDTDLEGSASNWHKVEEFATGKTDKKAQAKQLEKKERIEAFPHEDLTDRYGDYDPPDPDDY